MWAPAALHVEFLCEIPRTLLPLLSSAVTSQWFLPRVCESARGLQTAGVLGLWSGVVHGAFNRSHATLEATLGQILSQYPTYSIRFWWHLYGSCLKKPSICPWVASRLEGRPIPVRSAPAAVCTRISHIETLIIHKFVQGNLLHRTILVSNIQVTM